MKERQSKAREKSSKMGSLCKAGLPAYQRWALRARLSVAWWVLGTNIHVFGFLLAPQVPLEVSEAETGFLLLLDWEAYLQHVFLWRIISHEALVLVIQRSLCPLEKQNGSFSCKATHAPSGFLLS